MKNKKEIAKTIKVSLIILVIVFIILLVAIIMVKNNNKEKEISLNNLPELEYTEDEAKKFYSKVLIKYLDVFQGDFHIKYVATSTDESGNENVVTEEFSKKKEGNVRALFLEEDNERIVEDNEYFYHIDEDTKYIYKFLKEEPIDMNMDVIIYSLQDINNLFVKTGNEELNEINYYFEEYKMKKNNEILVRYYFDENDNLIYIKAYNENSKEQTLFEIQMLENRTYDFMFNMSDNYTLVE